ncbi:DNRLRE domain-containing protein [Dyadobacter flavalbus]|uniref:DNRLRE domain-containing protein n=1 Tax=Dyadobacter flavalbus TaxID=2579942 RepID=A0A5M8QR56_9BACT|nr:ELWxxDGT repeat protein [Dyadobacter flavalbus]KAA6438569.1 DNRLRE domain-containing protein [Dyadobacter flavalbus]
MKIRLLFGILFVLPGIINAQRIELLKDINQTPTGIQVYSSVTANNLLFFSLSVRNAGQLWRTDGTDEGTIQLTDNQANENDYLTDAGSYMVYTTYNGNETWLYRSDGTVGGTFLIHKTGVYSRITAIANVNGTAFFSVEVPVSEEVVRHQLWKTDGSVAGTMLVKDFGTTPAGESGLSSLFNFNGKLSFIVQGSPAMLWLSDGTEAGTQPVGTLTENNIQPAVLGNYLYFDQGSGFYRTDGKTISLIKDGFVFIREGLVIGNTIYFAARNTTYGAELWKSDGTTEGTVLVKDIYPGPSNSSDPADLSNLNGTLFFRVKTAEGFRLWKSDGTPEGTIQVSSTELNVGSYFPSGFRTVGNQIAFPDETDKLYKSDGTEAGTKQLTTFSVRIHGQLGNEIYFSGSDGSGTQLYKSDLTEAGTKAVTNRSVTAGSNPRQLTDVNGNAFFIASPQSGQFELWKSDGTPDGTVKIKDTSTKKSDYPPGLLTNVNGTLYFVVNQNEIWKSNGTTEGTVQVYKENDPDFINPINELIQTDKILIYNQNFFRNHLWRTDGTTAGTRRFTGSNAVELGTITGLTNVNETVFFGSRRSKYNDATDEFEYFTDLWKTNGETQNTILLRTFNPHLTFNPVAFKGELYFGAWDETNSVELWKSDGTVTGTKVVSQVTDSLGTILEQAGTIVTAGNYLYYITNAAGSYPLVRTDGTQAGTKVIKNLFPGGNLKDFNLYTAMGLVYLTAHDSDNNQELLWRTDGTAEGTYQLGTFDAFESSDFGKPRPAIRIKGEVNGKLLFVPFSRQLGDQLWTTDGTSEGTIMLTPPVSTPYDFTISPTVRYGNLFYFVMHDPQTGTELWQSDGTPEGTHLAAELNPKGNAVITELALIGGTLFMSAGDGNTGVELYKYIQSPAEDQTLYPVADAFIRNVPFEKTNFGTSQELGVKAGSREGYQRKTYLKFPLVSKGNVTSARLRIYGFNYQNEQQVQMAVTGIENDNWTETGIIWPNAPSVSGELLDSVFVNDQQRYHELDVTSFVQAQLAGDKTATFVLTNPTESNIRLFLSSRENKVNPPELIISSHNDSDARRSAMNEPEKKRREASVLYPNPVRDRFSVQLSEQHKGNAQLLLTYPNGKTQKLHTAGSTPQMQVDISSMKLTTGKYLLQVKSDSHQETFSVIVSN